MWVRGCIEWDSQTGIGATMAKFTERDEIEVALRYIKRVRSMQPSAAAVHALDEQESELRRALRRLDEASTASGSISLASTTSISKPKNRAGF
jgi:hypothetical protein